ncbi:LLM class flavin-dependent oxidoreductase [Pseudonocardia sp. CA-107938]|uniref:LLM class flavin-dependent oxidoreductase n=1 Tax=Pseudonocardia sp. CA-107938 TaxID=3240021 RepID=UPI003D8DEE83
MITITETRPQRENGLTLAGLPVGYLVHVAGTGGPAHVYRETVELAIAAEELGFASFWVAQHRTPAAGGLLPSPLVMLAAIAARTSKIRLGTAVIAAALENPVRLAEDAAVVDTLSGGRLELGFGAGNDPAASARFGRDHARRHDDCLAVIDQVCRAFEETTLVPAVPDLRRRLWWATGSPDGIDAAAARGIGILSGRPDDQAAAGLARYRTAATEGRVAACRMLAAGEPAASLLDRWDRDPARAWAGEVVVQTQPSDTPFDGHLDTLQRLSAVAAARPAVAAVSSAG